MAASWRCVADSPPPKRFYFDSNKSFIHKQKLPICLIRHLSQIALTPSPIAGEGWGEGANPERRYWLRG